MNKKTIFFPAILILIIAVSLVVMKSRLKPGPGLAAEGIKPAFGPIQNMISTTGTVLPKNRLETKPPVGGRIESMLVQEGEKVKAGQALAWMSSTERAALLDAAQSQGEEQLKYWKEAYKPIALLSPINGEVIVATIQPGQTVTTADPVVVLSDHLIVRAQVDETDIGKIKLDQNAEITLDAYPDVKIKAAVEHIYYESKTVNNVTIYEVDLIPEEVPLFFRSGMNTAVNFIVDSRNNVLLLPLEALHKDKDNDYCFVREGESKEPVKRIVKLGISDDKNAEILSGVDSNDLIVDKSKVFMLPKNSNGTNPFVPFGRKTQGQNAKK